MDLHNQLPEILSVCPERSLIDALTEPLSVPTVTVPLVAEKRHWIPCGKDKWKFLGFGNKLTIGSLTRLPVILNVPVFFSMTSRLQLATFVVKP